MKSICTMMVIFFSSLSFGQKEMNTQFSERLKKVNFDNVSTDLKNKAMKAGLSWECCIEEKCDCTDLLDPWENDKTLTYQQQISKMKADPNASQLQKDMVNFEQSILYGKGASALQASLVKNAFDKFPGYSFEAMKNRMDIYIQKMESETEDE